MNRKLVATLLLCNLLLLSIILSEWFFISSNELKYSINDKPLIIDINKLTKINLNQQPEESYADFVIRPLFIQGRKPVIEQNLTNNENINTGFDWVLSGVFRTKTSWLALLVKSNTASAPASSETTAKLVEYRKVALNDEVDGWLVSEIQTNKLRLTRGSNEKELLLRKKEKNPEQHQPTLPFYSGRDRRMKE